MEKESELINDREKLLQTFEYVLILENKCNELNNKLKDYNKIKKQLKSCKSDTLEKDLVIDSKVDEVNLLKGELDDCKSMCNLLTSDLSDYEKIKTELNEYKHKNLEKDLVIASKVDEVNLLRSELNSYKKKCQDLNDIISQK